MILSRGFSSNWPRAPVLYGRFLNTCAVGSLALPFWPLRSALFSPEMSCCFRDFKESVTFLIFHINRNFLNICPVPGTMLGAVETKINQTELLPLRNCPIWVILFGPLTVIPMTLRGQKTRFKPVRQTQPELPFSPQCCFAPGAVSLMSVWTAWCMRPYLWVWWLPACRQPAVAVTKTSPGGYGFSWGPLNTSARQDQRTVVFLRKLLWTVLYSVPRKPENSFLY